MLAVTIPMTVSRSAVIALAVLLVVLGTSWPFERRVNGVFLLVLGTLGMRLAVPGLIGTIHSLFTNSRGDPSRQSRAEGFNYAVQLINHRPWFGRGFGTFLPEQYTYLDDQVLLTVVETGFVGLLAVLALWGAASWTTREVRRLSADYADRDLAQTLLGCCLATLATAFTYDFFSFPTILALAMLTIGLSGALLRIVRNESRTTAACGGGERLQGVEHQPVERAPVWIASG
jgi:O-antigen ligase